ncbi:hypothetical protein [Streptomyces sp. H-KF8]|uniref:hypothetical protein n=1 Tax=Streptomyces sp. H-KF8 TaxID=1727216 RepID=UPI000AB87F2D|nr:hypothetical protein [Streptomyces sp. H-KF8]
MTWSWRGQAATDAVLIALVFVLDRSAWWLVLLVPHFVGTVAGCFQKADAEQHRDRRFGAIGLHVVALLVAPRQPERDQPVVHHRRSRGLDVRRRGLGGQHGRGCEGGTAVSDDYGYQVRRLETRTGGMEHELQSLRSKLEEVEDLDYELRDIPGDIRSLEDDLNTVRTDLTELDDDVRGHIQATGQALKRLTGRVQALEARLIAAGGAPLADIDTIDPEWKKLARTASHGRHVRSGLLPRHQRQAHRLKVREYEGAIAECDEHRDKVVEAAGTLASQPRTSREFKQAVMDFGMSRTLAESHDQRARQLAGPAQAALAQDDTPRQAKASLIEQGDKADRKLN